MPRGLTKRGDAVIESTYWIRARFGKWLHPVEKELHDETLCSTLEEAESALEEIKRHGGYCEAEIRRVDVRFVNGRSVGSENPHGEVVKRWKRNTADV